MDRTILIANTSNMPVAAREASHLHRHHHGRVLPRHGLRRGDDGRLDLALGRGAARDLRPARGDARRGGLPGLPGHAAGRLLRALGACATAWAATKRDRLGHDGRRGVAARRRLLRADDPELAARRREPSGPLRYGALAHRRHFPAISLDARATRYYLDQVARLVRGERRHDWRRSCATAPWRSCRRRPSCRRSSSSSGRTRCPSPRRSSSRSPRMLREDFLQQFAFDEVDALLPAGEGVLAAQDDPHLPRCGGRGAQPGRGAAAGHGACRCATRSPVLKTTPHEEAIEKLKNMGERDLEDIAGIEVY